MKRRMFIYTLVISAGVLIVAALIHLGSTWLPTKAIQSVSPNNHAATSAVSLILTNVRQPLPRLLLQLILIVITARVLGSIVKRLGQPAVIGEIAAGVLLGPSFLGGLMPA